MPSPSVYAEGIRTYPMVAVPLVLIFNWPSFTPALGNLILDRHATASIFLGNISTFLVSLLPPSILLLPPFSPFLVILQKSFVH